MHKKQSLFQISKRDTLPLSKALLIRGGILLLALIFCGLITTSSPAKTLSACMQPFSPAHLAPPAASA